MREDVRVNNRVLSNNFELRGAVASEPSLKPFLKDCKRPNIKPIMLEFRVKTPCLPEIGFRERLACGPLATVLTCAGK